MTFPPCFSSFAARPSVGVNSDRLQLFQQQQPASIATQIRPSFKPRSLTPELMQDDSTNSSQDSSTHDEQGKESMENDAARMLLALSKIVTNEISTEKREPVPSSPERDISTMEQKAVVSPPSAAIPKSIDVVNRDISRGWGKLGGAKVSAETIPREVLTTRSVSYSSLTSPLTPNTLPNNTNTTSFVDFASTNNAATAKRFRTVSLAGDELVSQDNELSPLLLPLSAPNTNNSTPPLLLRKQQLDLVQLQKELTLKLEHEALRRAIGDQAYSAVMASVAVPITPVVEKPRQALSFKAKGMVLDGNNHDVNAKSGVLQEAVAGSNRHLPMDLPPLLFQTVKRNHERGIASGTKLNTRVFNKRSSPARKATTKKQQSIQLAHGPRSNKKKASPKKQPRQRHTGKKFSWKAYPELEEFLITNREEYLSFSARNYTIEQRDYNNRLTSRLLEHAEANGYSTLFATCAFSAVRDRIRSYYKSYVQSFKRRRERQEQQDRLKKLEMQRH